MATKATRSSRLWRVAARQHGVVARAQLLELGYTPSAIRHRIGTGRLHPLWRGVYVVGRPDVTRVGTWLAATLACGAGAVISHETAAALWGIRLDRGGAVDVTVPGNTYRRRPGIRVHRRSLPASEVTVHDNLPDATPVRTLIDLAARLPRGQLERAIDEADRLDLVDPEALRAAVEPRHPGKRGVRVLRETLDRRTFVLTDSELERLFLPIARRAGLPQPLTQQRVNGFRVDFYWPELGLVVETDGLRYHRTPAQQARDRVRDQRHLAAGLTPLRFTHAQIRYEPSFVETTLAEVGRRLAPGRRPAA